MAKRKTLAQLIAAEDRAEQKMRRAFRAWEQARTARVRAEKRADKQLLERGGSDVDLRVLAAAFDDKLNA